MQDSAFSPNYRVLRALRDLNIKHAVIRLPGGQVSIQVDRTSMVHASSGHGEDVSYKTVLALLREAAGPAVHVMWDGRTDDWLGVGVYRRSQPAAES